MILLGLLLLVIAIVIVLVGVLSNMGSSHLLARSLEIFGYHVSGSTGRLLLIGFILGALAMLGLNLLLGRPRPGHQAPGVHPPPAQGRQPGEQAPGDRARPARPPARGRARRQAQRRRRRPERQHLGQCG